MIWENQYMPPEASAAPVIIRGLGPIRPTIWDTMPDIKTIVAANGRKAMPDRSAL